jgi:hypothetical protein
MREGYIQKDYLVINELINQLLGVNSYVLA